MHIGFLTPEYPTDNKPQGGLGNYTRKTAIGLVNRGHQVTVFVLGDEVGEIADEGIKIIYIKRTKFHWLLKKRKSISEWVTLFERWLNARNVCNFVLANQKEFALDILQVPNYQYPGVALCNNGLFPIICRCSSYSALLRSANGRQRSLCDTISDWFETQQVKEADAAFAPSQYIAQVYENFEAIKIDVIRTPIESINPNIDNSKYKQVAGKKYILYFGTLNGIKGVDILFRALPNVLDEHPEISVVLVGPNHRLPSGEKAMDWVDENLYKYQQNGRIIYFPPLIKSQLVPLIKNSIGVVLPSRVDNYPNACLESLSLGVPVVGAKQSSIEEMIVDGETGFLAENNDSESLKISICRLLQLNNEDLVFMKQNIAYAINNIYKEDRLKQLIEVYEKVTKEYKYIKNTINRVIKYQ